MMFMTKKLAAQVASVAVGASLASVLIVPAFPTVASAEAGCNDGGDVGYRSIGRGNTWTDYHDSWRYYAKITDSGSPSTKFSYLSVADSDSNSLYFQYFSDDAGMYNNGNHFDRVADRAKIGNQGSSTHTYIWKRSCTK